MCIVLYLDNISYKFFRTRYRVWKFFVMYCDVPHFFGCLIKQSWAALGHICGNTMKARNVSRYEWHFQTNVEFIHKIHQIYPRFSPISNERLYRFQIRMHHSIAHPLVYLGSFPSKYDAFFGQQINFKHGTVVTSYAIL